MEIEAVSLIAHVTPGGRVDTSPAPVQVEPGVVARTTCTGFDPLPCRLDAYDQSIAATAAAQDYRIFTSAVQAVARNASNVRSRSAIRAID